MAEVSESMVVIKKINVKTSKNVDEILKKKYQKDLQVINLYEFSRESK